MSGKCQDESVFFLLLSLIPYSYPCLPLFISFPPPLSSLPGTFSSSTFSVPPFSFSSFSSFSSSASYKSLPSSYPLSMSPLFPSLPPFPSSPCFCPCYLLPSSSLLSSSLNYLSFSSLFTPLISAPVSSFLLSLFLLWHLFSNLSFFLHSSIIYSPFTSLNSDA